jgi:hypothetical protein
MLEIGTKIIFKKKTVFTEGDGMDSPIYRTVIYTGRTGTIFNNEYGDYGIELDGRKEKVYVKQSSEGISIKVYIPEVNEKDSCYAQFNCPVKDIDGCSHKNGCNHKILKSTGIEEKEWDNNYRYF